MDKMLDFQLVVSLVGSALSLSEDVQFYVDKCIDSGADQRP